MRALIPHVLTGHQVVAGLVILRSVAGSPEACPHSREIKTRTGPTASQLERVDGSRRVQ